MGNLFRKAEQCIQQISSNDVFVEIGSARGTGGSTHYFAELAKQVGTVLHSVDLDDRQYIFRDIPNVIGYQDSGSNWAKHVFPTLGKTIACLYLDNYDYNYWGDIDNNIIKNQKIEYLEKYNMVMSNQDCVVEHLKQMMALLPFMGKNSVVICDDTYLQNDCWIGKCGAVVPYLVANGFSITEVECLQGSSYGVLLTNVS